MNLKQKLSLYSALIRWDKPVGTLLLLWPTLTALTIAGRGQPKALVTFIFICGVFLLRAAGGILNDITDRNLDKHVARTNQRVLAQGKISIVEALTFAAILLLMALVLVLLLNPLTLFLALIGAILTALYPLMKRFFQLPQVILGLVFNLGVLMAFAAQNNHIPLVAWYFYGITIIWTIAYDTMYAMADRDDDIKLQLKSTAILFGIYDKLIIAGLQGVIIFGLILLSWFMQFDHWSYLSILVCIWLFCYQQWLIKDRDPIDCIKAFSNNHWALFVVFLGIYLNFLP